MIMYAISTLSCWCDHILHAFWPLLCFFCVAFSLIILGSYTHVPTWLFQTGFYALTALFVWKGYTRFSKPEHKDVQKKITQANKLSLNPYIVLADRPSTRLTAAQKKLWIRNRRYAILIKRRIWPAWPAPGLAAADRYGLRFMAISVLFIAVLVTKDVKNTDFKTAFIPETPQVLKVTPKIAELWFTPPEYTGLAPLYVTKENQGFLEVPRGSVLTARINKGWLTPHISTTTGRKKFTRNPDGGYTLEYNIQDGDKVITLKSGLIPHLKMKTNVVADMPPILSIVEGPTISEENRVHLRYASQDDFGLKTISLKISPDRMIARRIGNPEPYVQDFALNAQKFIDQTLNLDLTDHDFAGLPVELLIEATDSFDQITRTDIIPVILPELEFTHPVARQLAAIRKEILWSADLDGLKIFANTIERILSHPESFRNDTTVLLGLNSAMYRMRFTQNLDPKTVSELRALLWSLALHIEGGSLRVATDNLKDALSQLAQALENPSLSEKDIQPLQEQLEQAMSEYLNSLLGELTAQLQEQGADFQIPDELKQHLQNNLNTNEFMQEMMDALQNGSREDLADALRQMEQMVDQLKNQKFQPMSKETQQYLEELSKLREVIREQEELLDKTQSIAPAERKSTEDYGEALDLGEGNIFEGLENFLPPTPSETYKPVPKEKAPPPETSDLNTEPLGDEQQLIREALERIRTAIEEAVGEDPDFMQRADKAMKDARDDLVGNAPGRSIPDQERALRELKKGLDEAMSQAASGIGQMLSFGLPRGLGQPRGQGSGKEDPLGRPMGEDGQQSRTDDIDLSDEEKRRRIRDIRNKILEKSDGVEKDPLTEDYYDNLLERF